METSPPEAVRRLYDATSSSYDRMMDAEIEQPVYADTLGRLAERIASLPGPVIDTSCGTGHVLWRYHERFDPARPLVGLDLSPAMVERARRRLGEDARVLVADMRDLNALDLEPAAAVLSLFAVHHLSPSDAARAFREWHRILAPGGQLVLAAWEGTGAIDYGDASDVIAARYTVTELTEWLGAAGLRVDRHTTTPDPEIGMDAVYLEATR